MAWSVGCSTCGWESSMVYGDYSSAEADAAAHRKEKEIKTEGETHVHEVRPVFRSREFIEQHFGGSGSSEQ